MNDSQVPLLAAARQWAPLTDAQGDALAALFSTTAVDARQHLFLPGDGDHDILFVSSGLLRFYYPSADGGREANKAFLVEGTFGGALGAAQLGLPLLYGVEALESTLVLRAAYSDFSDLMDADPAFERLGRKLAEHLLARKERRARSMLVQDASERYRDFADAHSDLMQRVPLYHIASLLGITDVHLSRIRRGEALSPVLNTG